MDDPLFMYVILARPPRDDDDDEPPILCIEHGRRAALHMCREMGGAVIQKCRRTGRLLGGEPEYEHVEDIYADQQQQGRNRKEARRG